MLLTSSNPKTLRGKSRGWDSLILHLEPATHSGLGNLCPWSTMGCRASCINTAGRGRMDDVQAGRVGRTWWFMRRRGSFLSKLRHELTRAALGGGKVCVRLNGTSDVSWESVAPWIFKDFPGIEFYDYTKGLDRMIAFLSRASWPANYKLVYSVAGDDPKSLYCAPLVMAAGGVVSFVSKEKPSTFCGFPVIDGDADDLRHLTPPGHAVWLSPKGKAKLDKSGFVLDDPLRIVNNFPGVKPRRAVEYLREVSKLHKSNSEME